MYLVEFRFTPKKELRAQEDIATSRLSWFLMLCKYSGQIIGTIEPNTNAVYVCNVYTPMRDSLDKKNDLPFVAKERANVEEFLRFLTAFWWKGTTVARAKIEAASRCGRKKARWKVRLSVFPVGRESLCTVCRCLKMEALEIRLLGRKPFVR